MRRWLSLFALALVGFGAAGACGIEQTGAGPTDAGATGGGGGTDSGSITTGTCFPGAKACPDEKGALVCEDANSPASGCKSSTACAPCELPHAVAKCTDAVGCDVDTCEAGWSNCNADSTDGCETSLANDPQNCGVCGTDCSVTVGPSAVCIEGACVENPCAPPTTGNCDKNPANGCESSASTDPSSCGGCGKKCNSTNGTAGCVKGVCDLLCNAGWGDCDNDKNNGCETEVKTHVSHCGTCGNACSATNGTPTCVEGKCATGGCSSGYADCDGTPGCETNTATDPAHCGSCTKACSGTPNGFATCASGSCGVGCSAGFSTCGSGTTCYDTTTDATHCGTSCATCPGPSGGNGAPACSGGACTVTCNSGFTKCGNRCVDLKITADNCGSCGKVCTAAMGGTAICVNSQCDVTCPGGVAECNNQCVDLNNNSSHCGQCNKKCGTNQKCEGAACKCQWPYDHNCGSYCAFCCENKDCGGGKKCIWGICTW